MRRLAVVIAVFAALGSSRALADPFDHLASRLAHYDDQGERVQPTGGAVDAPVADTAAQGGAEELPTPQAQPDNLIYDEGQPMWEEPAGAGYYDGGCGDCGMYGDGCHGCGGHFWGRAEYLLWWVRGMSTPPLVTTSPTGTPVGQAGILPNADILYGNSRINTDVRSGGRFTLGYFCDPCQQLGIEDSFFAVGNGNDSFFATSSGAPILARPFFNTQSSLQDALLIAYPQVAVGSIYVTSNSTLQSNDLSLRRALYIDCCSRFDILAGYRFFHLGEGLSVRTNVTVLDEQGVPAGTNFAAEDVFGTSNSFNAGQLGLNYRFNRGCWTWDIMGKLAIGGVAQRVSINGSTVVTVPDEQPVTNNGGVLALGSNIGTYRQTQFGVMPEIDINLRYQWSPLWTFSVGYTFIGLTNVVRPGDQISLNIDPRQLPPGQPGTFPQFAFHSSDLWVQGINFGLECNF